MCWCCGYDHNRQKCLCWYNFAGEESEVKALYHNKKTFAHNMKLQIWKDLPVLLVYLGVCMSVILVGLSHPT